MKRQINNLKSKTLEILIVCHKTPYPPNDGGAIASLNMIKGFRDAGAKVSVLAMQTHKHSCSVSEFPDSIKKGISWEQQWVDTKIKPLSLLKNLLFSKKPYNALRFESKEFSEKLKLILQKNNFNIVQLEGAYLASYVNIVKKYTKAKISLRAHNVEADIWSSLSSSESNMLKAAYFKILAKRMRKIEADLLKNIDLLVPISSKDAEKFRAINNNIIHVSPTGINADKFEKTTTQNPKTLFFIGALDWKANQESVLWFIKNIWKNISNKNPDWSFVVAGRNAPKHFADELKKHPVKFVGEVPDALNFIDKHNIMVVPLFAGSGIRIKIIEGMARAKCVFTSPIGIQGIPAKNKKEVYICNSESDWVFNLEEAMKNPNKVEEIRDKAFIFAKNNYLNSTIINKLYAFYSQHLTK